MTESNLQDRRLGYALVSTYGHALDAQLDQLCKAGCTKIYREKVTGARADRRELLKAVSPGDMVTFTRIDRLARSIFDLFGRNMEMALSRVQVFDRFPEPSPTHSLESSCIHGLHPERLRPSCNIQQRRRLDATYCVLSDRRLRFAVRAWVISAVTFARRSPTKNA
jgi:hypothetical protein